jgi:hypothetical protein
VFQLCQNWLSPKGLQEAGQERKSERGSLVDEDVEGKATNKDQCQKKDDKDGDILVASIDEAAWTLTTMGHPGSGWKWDEDSGRSSEGEDNTDQFEEAQKS